MPFVFDFDESWRRPLKRRKISSTVHMARPTDEEDPRPGEDSCDDSFPLAEADTLSGRPPLRQEVWTSDREELIQCIKRGERPTWVPKPNLGSLCAEADAHAEGANSSESLPPRELYASAYSQTGHDQLRVSPVSPDPFERPPSALHTGDFHEPLRGHVSSLTSEIRAPRSGVVPREVQNGSPPPWVLDAPSRFVRPAPESAPVHSSNIAVIRSRAPSLGSSLSSSFVMRAATSPLAHATSSPSFDPLENQSIGHPDRDDKGFRRRTLPPQTFASMGFSTDSFATSTPLPALRRDPAFPNRSHRPRRSLTSFTYQPASTAQGVYPSRNRRLSYASDSSPRVRSSMVGSFEESILRGRMSTPPSKPLDFVAQIGVLGKGDCLAKLKCPAHVSVPFPAVFYNYPSASGSRTISDDNPSPYVGTIDLEYHLKAVEEPIRRRKRLDSNDPDTLMAELTGPENTSIGRALAQQEPKAESTILLDGAYRVPQQGQLQVIIKNPNKTAVKLFLIPYNLEGMDAGTKTFVRQRSFSSGPIMENILSDKPIQDPLSGKHVLRYLIHLKFCCLSKGRFYLYDNIRVVFANRVPEGKERLQNEIQLPEPRYSPFVPGLRSRRPSVVNSPTSPQTSTPEPHELVNGLSPTDEHPRSSELFLSDPIPFHLGRSHPQGDVHKHSLSPFDVHHTNTVQDSNNGLVENEKIVPRPQSPEVHGFDRISTSQRGSPIPWRSNSELPGHRSSSPALINGDGLLSKKLRLLSKAAGQSGMKEADNHFS